jgi:NAD(P)-dependent dehydrogenase (short-subunit alcohol dehydrogenase family)
MTKVALITGASSGLGEAIAQRFYRDGMITVLADIDEARGAGVATSLGERAVFLPLNVTDGAQWATTIGTIKSQFGRLDVLVNCAGTTTMGTIESLAYDAFQREIAINMGGTFLGCQTAIPLMKATGGSIINIASGASKKIRADLVGYNATKAAVTAMTKSIALHCAEQGYNIRVNSVHPGAIHTAMIDKVLAQSEEPEALLASFIATHPIGRLGKPEEISSMCAWLASDESAFATAAEFYVDGGMTL